MASSSLTATSLKLPPPAPNDILAKYYWMHHFEVGPVHPAAFIHRIMTDYRDHPEDIVAQWIENMSPLYKLYNACINYGVRNGSPAKSIEARNYPGGSCRGDRAVQYVRNWHKQRIGGPVLMDLPPEGFPWGISQIPSALDSLSGSFSHISISHGPLPGGRPEPSSVEPINSTNHGTPTTQNVGTGGTPSNEEKKKAEQRKIIEKYEALREDDIQEIWPSQEHLEEEYEMQWASCIDDLLNHCHVPRKDKVTQAHISVHKPVQDEFSKALEILWVRELRQFFQNAVESEDLATRRPDLLGAIVYAAEKGANRPLTSLGNFIRGWDFVRFAFLLERLSKDPSLPDLVHIKEAIKTCRSLRNTHAHPAYDPSDQGLSDAKLASVLDSTRGYLPKVNNFKPTELDPIYGKLALLESILFQREPENQEGEDVFVFFKKITDVHRPFLSERN